MDSSGKETGKDGETVMPDRCDARVDFIVMFLKFSSLKSNIINRLTRRSRSGKHSKFGHVIEQEKCHAVACWEFHLILNLVNHFLLNKQDWLSPVYWGRLEYIC